MIVLSSDARLERISADRHHRKSAHNTHQRNYRTTARTIRSSTGYYDDDVTMRQRYSYEWQKGRHKNNNDVTDNRPLYLKQQDGFKRLCSRAQSSDRRPRSMRALRTDAERSARANITAEPREMFKLWSQRAHTEYATADVVHMQPADTIKHSLRRVKTAPHLMNGRRTTQRCVSVAGDELVSARGQLYFKQARDTKRCRSLPQHLLYLNASNYSANGDTQVNADLSSGSEVSS